jgi:hypothetical protein
LLRNTGYDAGYGGCQAAGVITGNTNPLGLATCVIADQWLEADFCFAFNKKSTPTMYVLPVDKNSYRDLFCVIKM